MGIKDKIKKIIGDDTEEEQESTVMIVEDAKFLVKESGNGMYGGSNPWVWFEVLEGSDQGIRVRIPLFHEEYDEKTSDGVRKLRENDIVKATIYKRENDDTWRVRQKPEVIDNLD